MPSMFPKRAAKSIFSSGVLPRPCSRTPPNCDEPRAEPTARTRGRVVSLVTLPIYYPLPWPSHRAPGGGSVAGLLLLSALAVDEHCLAPGWPDAYGIRGGRCSTGSGRAYFDCLHLSGEVVFRNRDRFQHRHDLVAALFEPRRQQHGMSQSVVRLIARESTFSRSRAFH